MSNSKETAAKAANIFKNNKAIKELFVNPKGEFFTSRNFAENTVKDKKEIKSILRVDSIDESVDSDENTATDYSKLVKKDLQAELTAREIQFDDKATNAELVKLLEANDASKENE